MSKTIHAEHGKISFYGKVIEYPCGLTDYIASSSADFREKGWEDAQRKVSARRSHEDEAKAEDDARSMRRARARVRRLALANDFRWFVTLTLDKNKVDRYDPAAVIKKLNQWCSNRVKRNGLKYILVPERHKDGAIHFHGFFNDALEAVPSFHNDSKGHPIYNIPAWQLGFTAAIEVYGDYPAAVAYCCKYIGKQGDKPAGRWYYSGGALAEPQTTYADLSISDLRQKYGEKVWTAYVPGRTIAVVNGVRKENV